MRPEENGKLHVVIGASGGIGSAVVRALAGQGKPVRAVNRSGNANVPPGVELMAGDVSHPADAVAFCQGAAVVYNCANPEYHEWAEKFPAILDGSIEGAASNGARLVFADNLYMYGKVDRPMTEELPYNPCSKKGEVRARMAETLLDCHRRGHVQAAIGRASDFYGPGVLDATGGEIVMRPALEGKPASVLGNPDVPRTFSYIDNFARGLVTLGEQEAALGQVWHIPNDEPVTTRRFLEMVYTETGHPVKMRVGSRQLVAAMGLFNRQMREFKEILYQFEAPFIVDHSKYERAFGPLPVVRHPQAIQRTVDWFRNRRQLSGASSQTARS